MFLRCVVAFAVILFLFLKEKVEDCIFDILWPVKASAEMTVFLSKTNALFR